MAILKACSKKRYTNDDAVERVVNYVLNGSGGDGCRDKVLLYDGLGLCTVDREHIIATFKSVQSKLRYSSTIGTRVYHEILTFTREEGSALSIMGRETMQMVAQECARIYYSMGHQVLYVVCRSYDNSVKIHFVVNTVNFTNGSKWYNNQSTVAGREKWMNQILQKYLKTIANTIFM